VKKPPNHFPLEGVADQLTETGMFTPLLHKDAIESNLCFHKKAVSNFFGILSKGNSWIDPGDAIDFTAVPLWVRV